MSKVKGTGLVLLRDLIKEQNPDYLDVFKNKLTPTQWNEFQTIHSLAWRELENSPGAIGIGAQLFFPDDPDAIQRIGFLLAQKALTGVYRIFLRIPSPHHVIQRTANLWRQYHGAGKAHMENVQPNSCVLFVEDYPDMFDWLIEYLCGYLQGTFELTRANNVRVKCIEKQQSTIKWLINWE